LYHTIHPPDLQEKLPKGSARLFQNYFIRIYVNGFSSINFFLTSLGKCSLETHFLEKSACFYHFFVKKPGMTLVFFRNCTNCSCFFLFTMIEYY